MTCCVELLLAGLLALPVPQSVEARVRAGVAARWRVEAARVELAWSRPSGGVREDADVSLAGGGREGWLAVTFTAAGLPAQVARVRAGVHVPVPVAARDLASGAQLEAADVAWQERTVWGPPQDGASSAAPEPGWRTRRPIAAGEPLAWPAVAPPPAVEAGAPVTLVWKQDGVRVSRPGVAMNGALRGGWVRVRVDGRADRFVGRATAVGEVSLAGGMR
jgi:flagella basal body P-ring formation protein FlgA